MSLVVSLIFPLGQHITSGSYSIFLALQWSLDDIFFSSLIEKKIELYISTSVKKKKLGKQLIN